MSTISDMVTEALEEIRSARAGDVINSEDMDLGLRTLNRILNAWNADERAVYNEEFNDYTLTPNLSPHTIGPSGTFNVTQRPVSLEYAALNLGNTPNVFTPIAVRGDEWYQRNQVPGITLSVPTDVYYDTGWPLGKLYFYGIPTVAYGVRLWTRVLLASVVLTDTFSLPPGYQDALTLTLAERLAPAFGQRASEETKQAARDARDLIFSVNDTTSLDINTRDGGMPTSSSDRTGYDYLTGTIK